MESIEKLKEYVSYASVSTDPQFKAEVFKAHDFVARQLEELSFEVESVKTPLNPIVLGKRRTDPSHPHVMLYAHYDVQPADPVELWKSPPFEARIEDNKLYARGSTDNKGPFIAQIMGLKALLKEHPDLPLNITFMVEGEEEIGSPSFERFLKEHKAIFQDADVLLISDTTCPSPDQITFTTALRGIICLEVDIFGPEKDLHSGLFGGGILNPIRALSKILASLHNDDGLVNIDGFYDGIEAPEDWEREELKKYPMSEEKLKELTGVPAFSPPKGYTAMEAARFLPTLEYNGIYGGYQGEGSKTIIPSKVSVKITCRLVPGQNPSRIINLVKKTLQERKPNGVRLAVKEIGDPGEPYVSIPPERSNSPSPYPEVLGRAYRAAHDAIVEVTGNAPLYVREGGSIPIIGLIKRETQLDSVMLGLSLNGDNMHSPNECYNLKMLEQGEEIYKHILKIIAKL